MKPNPSNPIIYITSYIFFDILHIEQYAKFIICLFLQ